MRGALNQLKSSLHGHENKLRQTNPPTVNLTPYNTIIVSEEYADTGSVTSRTVKDIAEALLVQLGFGPDSGVAVRIKIQRIDAWALPSKAESGGTFTFQQTPIVAAKFFSLISQVDNAATSSSKTGFKVGLKEIRDEGLSGQQAAIASYSWPRDQADMPLGEASTNADTGKVISISSEVGNRIILRYHLHWSTIGQPNLFD